jgi:hypothetical protein
VTAVERLRSWTVAIMWVLCLWVRHRGFGLHLWNALLYFFLLRLFQSRITTLLLILHLRSVTGWVDNRHLCTKVHRVVQNVRTLRQWSSLPMAGTLWCSYWQESDLKPALEPTYKTMCQPYSTTVVKGEASVLQPTAWADNCWCWQSVGGSFHANTHNGIWTRIKVASKW